MRIGVDLRPFFTGSKFRGIGMYSRELIKELLKIGKNDTFHFLNLYGEYTGDPLLDKNCYVYEYYSGPKIVDVGERQLFSEVSTKKIIENEVKHFLKQSKIDVMLFTSPTEYGNLMEADWFANVGKVAILYDLIPLIFPEQCLFDPAYKADYEKSLEFLKQMDLLLAISQSAKDDAVRLLGIPEEKIIVVYAGIDKDFEKLESVEAGRIKEKYGISDAFLMFAGGIDFKKNIEDVIIAYSKLPKGLIKRNQLVITGKASDDLIEKFLNIARDNGVDGRVICTGYIPKDDLIALYNITELLVFPSLYEGFGLPVIEAMACGARVVTSNVSSLKEIAEGHALLVNPKSVKSIVKGMETILNHPIEAMDLADDSIEYAKSYTWEKVAQKTAEGLKQLVPKSYNDVDYEYRIDDADLQNIAKAFARNNVLLRDEEKKMIIDELILLQEHSVKREISFKNRILYDVTVVEEWLKAGYTTGIARVSTQLFQQLKKMTMVLPIIVRKTKKNVSVDVVEWGTWKVIETDIDLNEDDVYVMPELQLRGIQVDKKHPSKDFFREKGIKCYAMVYDILPLRMPQYFEKKTSDAFDPYIKEIVNDYDGILCDSKWVADDIINYCHENNIVPRDHKVKMGFFHLGPNSFEKKEIKHIDNSIVNFMNGMDNVFVMVGTIEPRKGHELVLKTFEKMWEEGYEGKLCFAGHVGWNMMPFIDYVKNHPENGKRLGFFEAVNDVELEYIYNNASALIQASAGEGFGLPLIEAGHYAVPIICSDIEVFHEVAGNHAIYFKQGSQEALRNVIDKFEEMEDNGTVPDSSKIEYVTWEQTAVKVYEMVSNEKEWYSKI